MPGTDYPLTPFYYLTKGILKPIRENFKLFGISLMSVPKFKLMVIGVSPIFTTNPVVAKPKPVVLSGIRNIYGVIPLV
jgi:hypothetical protein